MKATLGVGAFLAAVLIALPLFALAGSGIPAIPIGLEGDPGSVVIAQTKTNSAGVAVFRNVKPGKYRLTIGTINWGDGSTARGLISQKPTAFIEINVPGQAKAEFTLTFNGQTTKTADRRFVPFAVAGNKVQTVTVRFYYTLSL